MNLDQLRKEIKEKEEEKYEDAKEKYEKEILFELSQFKDTKNNLVDRLMYGQALFLKKIGKLTQLMDLSISVSALNKILAEKLSKVTKLDNTERVIFGLTMAEYVVMLIFSTLIAVLVVVPAIMVIKIL